MNSTRVLVSLVLSIVISLSCGPLCFAGDLSNFKDEEDGAFDISNWLTSAHGFIPVPIIVTEPAIGYGGGVALAFFHPPKDKGTTDADQGEKEFFAPPSISLGFAAYTESDSWFAGGGHMGVWKDDRIRYVGVAGLMDLNLSFHIGEQAYDYNMDGGFLYQQLKFRVKDTRLFLGAEYVLFDSKSLFNESSSPPDSIPESLNATLSGLGAVATWDGRDNVFTPNRGQKANLTVSRYDKALGGDFDYTSIDLQALSYHPLHEKFVLGLRFEGSVVDGDVPFFALPFIQLRGVPAMRYQDEKVAVVEAEGRWRVWKRWSLVGFVGAGRTSGPLTDIYDEGTIVTRGLGFRYLAARKLNIHMGIDVARGPEDTAFYLVMGSSWR